MSSTLIIVIERLFQWIKVIQRYRRYPSRRPSLVFSKHSASAPIRQPRAQGNLGLGGGRRGPRCYFCRTKAEETESSRLSLALRPRDTQTPEDSSLRLHPKRCRKRPATDFVS